MFKSNGMKLLGVGVIAYAVYWAFQELKASNGDGDSATETFNVDIVQRPAEIYGQRTGRAVGQTLLDNPYEEGLGLGLPDLQQSSAAARSVGGEEVKSTMWDGQITDTSLKYRVGAFGTNFSGSAIGVAN
jgi:hypothetical protein